MDQGFRFLCQAETKRLVSLLGISVALILVVQYSELPNSKLLSSLTATIASFNNVHLNGSNSSSTHAFEEIVINPQASPLDQGTSSVVHNGRGSVTLPAPEKAKGLDTIVVGSPMGSVQGKDINLTSQGTASSLLVPQPMVPLPNRTFLDSEMDSRSHMISVISTSTSAKSNTTDPAYKDGKLGSLQNSNLTPSNNKPVTTKNSRKRPSKVVSISEMNLLLQHSHASSKLAVCIGFMCHISEV